MDLDVWGPPLIVLGVTFVCSIAWIVRFQSKTSKSSKAEAFLAEKNRYLEALRELEADALKMDTAVYETERETLLKKAENALQRLDQPSTSKITTASAEGKTQHQTSSVQSSAYIVLLVLLGVVLSLGLYRYSRDRVEGEVMTGSSVDVKERNSRLTEAKKALEVNPEDMDALNILAYDALINRRLARMSW